MFSLIISIIAIALVVVLAGASLYYGGDAFNKGTSKGEAAKLINEAQQIQGAFTMHKVDEKGLEPASVAELTTDEYLAADLSAVPAAWTFDLASDPQTVQGTAPSSDVCDEINAAGNSQATCAGDGGSPEVFTVTYVL
tara:strand:- start:2120 stop:2533 length:414 start_codon:yes stop_codon:yes gene_type:complete